MKKNFTTFFIFTAMMLVALSGCGEDIQVPNSTNDGEINPTEERMTVFSSSSDGTRTSIDTNAKFYWEAGDYIWVDTLKNGSFTGKSHSIELSNPTQAPSAKFYFRQIVLTEPKYDLTYTGNNSSKGTEVTIAAEQTQSGWNSPAHLGESGDCGVAEAIRDNSTGTYSFSLKHKAAYLVLSPYLSSVVRDDENCKLTKIEIVAANGDAIAGTYLFSAAGLNTSSVTNPSDTIKLSCTDGFALTKTSSNACFAVIQPGEHTLTIKYHVTSTKTGRQFIFVKDAFTKDFKVNGVTTIRHELQPMILTLGNMYAWGATVPWTMSNCETSYSPIAGGDFINSPWNREVPNINEMYWFLVYGDPRFDFTTPWVTSTGSDIFTGAVWIKKKSTINSEGHTILGYVGKNNADMRQLRVAFTNVPATTLHVQTIGIGRPDDYQKYVFLPISVGFRNEISVVPMGSGGCYWLRTAVNDTNASESYGCYFTVNSDEEGALSVFGLHAPIAVIRAHSKRHGCYIDPIKQLILQ